MTGDLRKGGIMNRRWLLMGIVAIATMGPWSAEAGYGRRGGNHVSMTPYGPIPGGVSLPAYQQMVEQRQVMMQQQMLYQQQQAAYRQYLQSQKAQQKGKKGDAPLTTLQPTQGRAVATRKKAQAKKGATTKVETLIGTTAKTDTTKAADAAKANTNR
jgi:hypothetical protein